MYICRVKHWWKVLAVLLISYSIVGGFLMDVPDLGILGKTIRNLHFHVPMWFTMIFLLLISYIYSIMYLAKGKAALDTKAESFIEAAVLFGLLGVATGAFWAWNTWGKPWVNDPKLNGVAIGMLIYFAYFLLRNNIEDELKRGKFAAVYNLFAFPIFIVLIIVLPKMAENSLHPGSGDTVGFSSYKLDSDLRKVFYPAVLGWMLFGIWVAGLRSRFVNLKLKHENR
ncbi:cytochrome c biogenesis protein CcsA [bacterium]|nr:cytochrome c biogenesis protein CcsA [bacterium]